MKKILFVAPSLKVGGVERALVEQVNYISKEEDVTLFLFSKTGEYLEELSKEIKLISGNYVLDCLGKTREESKINPLVYLIRNAFAFLVKLLGRKFVYRILFLFTKKFKGFDIVISYVNDQGTHSLYGGCNQFIINNVSGGKKVSWIHSDPRRLDKRCMEDYLRMDLVVNVSYAMKTEFDNLRIVDEHKSLCVYNRLNVNKIIDKSKQTFPYKNSNIKILTVGRLEELKGIKELLGIAKKLSDDNKKFVWYFLGDGVLRSYCEQFIKLNNLENNVLLLGNKSNPYPYILNADICVSGSKTETFGISIVEALILNTPVIALNYLAISEIIDGTNGKVCISYDEIYTSIREWIDVNVNFNKNIVSPKILVDYNKENQKQFQKILD